MRFQRPIALILVLLTTSIGELCLAEGRQHYLNELAQIKQRNRSKILSLTKSAQSSLNEIQLEINKENQPDLDKLESEIRYIKRQKLELLARQSFYDQLTFQIDQNYKGGPFLNFLQGSIKQMSLRASTNEKDSSNHWQFLTYLSAALQAINPKEVQILTFVEGYINYSSLLHPLPPKRYLALRNYSNGSSFYSAQPFNPEKIGEFVERKNLASVKKTKPSNEILLLEAPILQKVDLLRLPENEKESEKLVK